MAHLGMRVEQPETQMETEMKCPRKTEKNTDGCGFAYMGVGSDNVRGGASCVASWPATHRVMCGFRSVFGCDYLPQCADSALIQSVLLWFGVRFPLDVYTFLGFTFTRAIMPRCHSVAFREPWCRSRCWGYLWAHQGARVPWPAPQGC